MVEVIGVSEHGPAPKPTQLRSPGLHQIARKRLKHLAMKMSERLKVSSESYMKSTGNLLRPTPFKE